ncbi:MAG: multiheme c-type cytochrome [Planctomycetota bacterium]
MMGKTACRELACPRTLLSGVESVCIYLLLAATALAASPSQAPVQPAQGEPAAQKVITIFFTGNELGELQPCGCSGGQLGGFDRRDAVLDSVEPKNRFIFDTGFLVPELTEQNLIKFNIIVQALSQLGYDMVNLTEQDILIARKAGLLDVLGSAFNVITADGPEDAMLPAKFTRRFTLDGNSVDITVAVIDTEEQIERLSDLFAASADEPSSTVNVLIFNRLDSKKVTAVSETNLADLLIIPPQSDEPTLISDSNARPLVVSAGRLGKYVGKIRVALPGPVLSFSSIPITEDLPQNQVLVDFYKDYQRLLKEANLLEKYPRFILPDNLQYVGSKSCKLCHDYEYEKWLTSSQVFIHGLPKQPSPDSRHADAFATLEKVGSDYDPECVICHVVGMQFQSGFISPEKTSDLKDVGCENCHGPGSDHLSSLGAVETSGPMSTCTDCHNTEHSAEYAGNEKQYFEKIIHWREPVSFVRVKEPNHAP